MGIKHRANSVFHRFSVISERCRGEQAGSFEMP